MCGCVVVFNVRGVHVRYVCVFNVSAVNVVMYCVCFVFMLFEFIFNFGF